MQLSENDKFCSGCGKSVQTKPGILIGDKTTIIKTTMSETAMDNSLPENVKADVTFDELFGIWTGEIELTKMDGFAEMAKMQGGPDVSQEIEEMLSTPTAVELKIEDTGEWSFDMNVGMGMDICQAGNYRVNKE